MVSVLRAAIREARWRRRNWPIDLWMFRSRVYAVLASADNATDPLTIQCRTAAGRGRRSSKGLDWRASARHPKDPGDPGGNPVPADRNADDDGDTGGLGEVDFPV